MQTLHRCDTAVPQEQAQAPRPSAESSLVAVAPSCVFTINGNPTDAQDM
jgi:hypothetical protein